VAALNYRRRTGRGQYIDSSQLETSLQLLSPLFLDYEVNRRTEERKGNRCDHSAPHGVFRCRGEDRWCAIAVSTDDEWKAFRTVLGDPEWAAAQKFATFIGRKRNEDELETQVEEWTKKFTAEEVMKRLQEAGVPAGVVATGEDVYGDPQLLHRDHFTELSHPEMGAYPHERSAAILSDSPGRLNRPAPCLGEHNHYVYTKLLGMSEEEFSELLNEKTFE
jgi:benzylsuccinate CoA-transferase BbsF subunit